MEIKSYHFEILFSKDFFTESRIYTKTSPEKGPIIVQNAW